MWDANKVSSHFPIRICHRREDSCFGAVRTLFRDFSYNFHTCPAKRCEAKSLRHGKSRDRA